MARRGGRSRHRQERPNVCLLAVLAGARYGLAQHDSGHDDHGIVSCDQLLALHGDCICTALVCAALSQLVDGDQVPYTHSPAVEDKQEYCRNKGDAKASIVLWPVFRTRFHPTSYTNTTANSNERRLSADCRFSPTLQGSWPYTLPTTSLEHHDTCVETQLTKTVWFRQLSFNSVIRRSSAH